MEREEKDVEERVMEGDERKECGKKSDRKEREKRGGMVGERLWKKTKGRNIEEREERGGEEKEVEGDVWSKAKGKKGRREES